METLTKFFSSFLTKIKTSSFAKAYDKALDVFVAVTKPVYVWLSEKVSSGYHYVVKFFSSLLGNKEETPNVDVVAETVTETVTEAAA